jgi:hypothetical protein
MEHGRSYLMDGCQVMVSGRVRPPAIIVPTLALSLYHRNQVSLSANDKSAHLLIGSASAAIITVSKQLPDPRNVFAAAFRLLPASLLIGLRFLTSRSHELGTNFSSTLIFSTIVRRLTRYLGAP